MVLKGPWIIFHCERKTKKCTLETWNVFSVSGDRDAVCDGEEHKWGSIWKCNIETFKYAICNPGIVLLLRTRAERKREVVSPTVLSTRNRMWAINVSRLCDLKFCSSHVIKSEMKKVKLALRIYFILHNICTILSLQPVMNEHFHSYFHTKSSESLCIFHLQCISAGIGHIYFKWTITACLHHFGEWGSASTGLYLVLNNTKDNIVIS